MDRNLQLLGIAKKAGLLAIGGESTSAAARSGSAKAIATTADASDGAKRRAQNDSDFCGAVYVATEYRKFEFGRVVGRGAPATLAVLDAGLAEGFVRGLAESDPLRYGAAAKAIAEKAVAEKAAAGKAVTGKARATPGEKTSFGAGKSLAERKKTNGKRRTAK